MNLAALIRSARKAKGMRQHQVAKAIGVTPSAVSQWEKNLTKPEPENIPPLAQVLGLDLSKLLAERVGAGNPLRNVTPKMAPADDLERDLGRPRPVTGPFLLSV